MANHTSRQLAADVPKYLPSKKSLLFVQLDKATKQAGEASKLQDLLAALEETIQANEFLCRFDNLDMAVSSLAKNRVSSAHAAQVCAGMFDRMLKANTTIPNAAALQAVLEQPPAGAHHPFFPLV